MGFPNTRFIMDKFHLLDSGLKNKFGKVGYELLKSHLIRLVNSPSELEFDSILESTRQLLSALPQQNGELETELNTFANKRACHALFCLENIPCNRHKRGTISSAANHSSVLAYLNNGFKSSNAYQEHPTLLIRDLLKRQRCHVITTDERLFKMSQHMVLEQAKLECERTSFTIIDLKKPHQS